MIAFEIEEDWPGAEKVNAFIAEIAKRLPAIRPPRPGGAAGFAHPFQVTVEADPRELNAENRLWRISTHLGCVNDVAAAIVYRNQDDPRDWLPPVRPGVPIDPAGFTDRTALEVADPPFHLLTAPGVSGVVAADDFAAVSDAARPAFFRTREMWQKQIFQASVTLTNDPEYATSSNLPPILLSRLPRTFRLVAGRKPVTPVAYAGGILEVATLYLLRDDEATDCFSDQMLVRQRVFWNVASIFAQPANPLDGVDTSDPFGQIIASQVGADLETAAAVSFWTQ